MSFDDKLLSLISLCKRANLLEYGFDVVVKECLSNNKGIVIVTSDTSQNTIKKLKSKLENVKIIHINYTKDDIFLYIKKYCGVLYVKDEKLSKKIIDIIQQ